MTNALFSTLLFLLSAAYARAEPSDSTLSCSAVYRTLDEKNNTVEHSVALTPKQAAREQVKLEAIASGRIFTLTEDRRTGDLFGQITTAPGQEKGNVFRGAPDSQGRFTATEVVGFTVYRLECSRK
jgi:hypothetical protein